MNKKSYLTTQSLNILIIFDKVTVADNIYVKLIINYFFCLKLNIHSFITQHTKKKTKKKLFF